MYILIIIKKFLLFFFIVYKNERKEYKFWQQKYQKKTRLYNKNKKISNIDDIDVNKILVSKKEQYGKHNSFNTLLGIMITMLLDHYIFLFHKLLATLINFIKIK